MNTNLSLILPVYNEDKNIRKFINSVHKLNNKIEIIVVDNNSYDKSKNEIKKTKAKYYFLKDQGYGRALRFGIDKATKEIIATCEPDGTFDPKDIFRLLKYLKKKGGGGVDCVFGTRTNKKFIQNGAKMNFLYRAGNKIVAKILQFLFTDIELTDVGCTLKIFKKLHYEKIKKKLTTLKSDFQPELMINLLLLKNIKVIEIPIKYKRRVGYSKITSNYFKTTVLAIKMIFLIFKLKAKQLLINN